MYEARNDVRTPPSSEGLLERKGTPASKKKDPGSIFLLRPVERRMLQVMIRMA